MNNIENSREENSFSKYAKAAYGIRATSPNTRFTRELATQWLGLEDAELPQRWEVLNVLLRIGRDIGLTDELQNHLQYLMRHTGEEHWQWPNTPIVFKSVTQMARDLGVSERTIRNREQRLADMGLITHNDSGNYRRYALRDRNGAITAFGVNLSPIWLRRQEFYELEAIHAQRERHWKDLRAKISAKRRYIIGLINECLLHEDLELKAEEWLEDYKDIRLVRSSDSVKVLDDRLTTLLHFEAEILSTLKDYERAKVCELTGDITATAAANFLHTELYKYPTDLQRLRNQSVDNSEQSSPKGSQANGPNMTSGHARKTVSKGETGAEIGDCKGNMYSMGPTGAENLSPENIYLAAGRDFREAIDMKTGDKPVKALTFKDIQEAAEYIRPYLGVSEDAWLKAKNFMGPWSVSICLMVSAQPKVRNSGAYLRGMIDAAQEGELHLHRSVFGQLKRGGTVQ